MRTRTFVYITLLFIGTIICTSCRSFDPIQTEPPEPAVQADGDSTVNQAGRTVDLHFTTGASELPERIAELEFRIEQITLVAPDSSRDVRELSHATISIGRDSENTYALLRTSIEPDTYEQLEVTLEDIYVTYSPNAGGPLTVDNTPITVSLPEIEASEAPAVLRLTLDVGQSLRRGYNGRWSFTPQITAEVIDIESTAQAPVEND